MYINDGKLLSLEIAAAIAAGHIGKSGEYTKVSLGFGDILINPKRSYDGLNPIIAMPFNEAPTGEKAVNYNIRDKAIVYYVEVPYRITMPADVLKWLINLSLIKVCLMYTTGLEEYSINDDIIFGLYDSFRSEYHMTAPRSCIIDRYYKSMIRSRIHRIINGGIEERLFEDHFDKMINKGVGEVRESRERITGEYEILSGVMNGFYMDMFFVAMKLRMYHEYSFGRNNTNEGFYEYLMKEMSAKTGDVNIYKFIREAIDKDSKYLAAFTEAKKKKSQRITTENRDESAPVRKRTAKPKNTETTTKGTTGRKKRTTKRVKDEPTPTTIAVDAEAKTE